MVVSKRLLTFLLSSSLTNSFTVIPRPRTTTTTTTPINRLNNVLYSQTDEATDISAIAKPGTAKMDKPWGELGFEYRETKSHLKIIYRDGKWGEPELVQVSCTLFQICFYFKIRNFIFLIYFNPV